MSSAAMSFEGFFRFCLGPGSRRPTAMAWIVTMTAFTRVSRSSTVAVVETERGAHWNCLCTSRPFFRAFQFWNFAASTLVLRPSRESDSASSYGECVCSPSRTEDWR